MTAARILFTFSLAVLGGCANCGEKSEEAPSSGKPEPPVIVHSKLPDGGRGRGKIVDFAERPSPFEAGTEPLP